uniref:Uncharacterized protein LOC113794358 n=1 Tax=Dermatophagoides pteronyssinus TaxID=6956 RepID=A0A6P6Y462_DERPT|nr:uncharacterized protein LOC113794358 [Dermatophagoides pteronyssinus]
MTISIIPKSLKNISFEKIFQRDLFYLQIFTFRLKFSLEDYQNKKIPWIWKTFQYTIFITSNALAAIFCLGLLSLWPESHPFMKYHDIEAILKTERMDLFILALFIILIMLEALFLHLLNEVLNYRYHVGQFLLTVLSFIGFVIELFQVKLQELFQLVQKIFRRNWNNKILKKIFWNRFQVEYVKLYSEIANFNISFGTMLLYLETISKSSIIISCMFLSEQEEISQYCIMAIVSLLSIFFYITTLYSRVARLPSNNRRCCKSIMSWLARTQWSSSKTKFYQSINGRKIKIINRTTIKSNLFVQIMSENKLGFTCGHLFFITKFKYIQLLLLNFTLIIKFYKKIIHASKIKNH